MFSLSPANYFVPLSNNRFYEQLKINLIQPVTADKVNASHSEYD